MRFVVARAARRVLLLLARRLDAAQGAAKFLNLALIGELLPLGDFHQFENFVQLVNRVFQRFGNLGGVSHRLADGRNFGRSKIRGFDPRPGLRATIFGLGRPFRAPLPLSLPFRLRSRGWGKFRCNFRRGFQWRLTHGFLVGISVRMENLFRCRLRRFLGMRLAKVAGGVGFGFCQHVGADPFLGGFGQGRLVLGGHSGLGGRWTRSAGAAPAAAATTATYRASTGTARGRGRIQIRMFVRHNLSLQHGGFTRKSNGELRLLFHKQRQSCCVAVQEILIPNRAYLAIAEKTTQSGQVKI